MKFLPKIILILFLLGVAFFLLYFANKINNPSVAINGVYFKAEIAKTEKDKAIGLSKYKTIDDNFAMVFPFARADYYTFWMKDMNFPIDIIFVRDNKIVDVFRNVPNPNPNINLNDLPRYQTKRLSNMVLEIKANLFDKYNFKIGDSVKIEE